MTKTCYIGLDAGGSKTELCAEVVPGQRWSLYGPGANLQRAGVEDASAVLADLVRQAAQREPAARYAVCAGVAGAGREAEQEALAAAVRARLDGLPVVVRVVHDAAIALEAAFAGESGVVVIAGTGSVAFARTPEGRIERAGGWGYLLGDEGSGHALAVAGLRAVCAALDGGPDTRLVEAMASRFGLDTVDRIIQRVYREAWPVQQAAPVVAEVAAGGDAVAVAIVAEQTAALAAQVGWLAARVPEVAPRLVLLGGLTSHAAYQAALVAALRERLPRFAVQPLAEHPVVGALRLARALPAGA